MRLKTLIYFTFSIGAIVAACSPKQRVSLDPVSIAANAPGANIYRGSYTKTTDLLHTRLDLKFNWDSAQVIGKAYLDLKPYFYPSDRVVLNAKGFKINSISLVKNDEEIPLKYRYDKKLIDIQLDRTYSRNDKLQLLIDYVASPYELKVGQDIASEDHRGLYFINRDGKIKDKPRQIWTQGETEENSIWFPTIEGPQEKMTQEISLTVDSQFTTLSNGSLDYSTDNGDGTRTDTWRQEQPHSTYLTMIAVGDFVITKDTWRDKEVSYYMEPAFSKNAKLIFGKTPEMIEFFSQKMGLDYPWDKYSQIVVRDYAGGAMENTTASLFFEGMNMTEGQYLDENHEDIISHELFHHWFGNLVTAESWANLPLNESFATYGEYLWNEHKYGRDYADYKSMLDRTAYLNSGRSKDLNVIRFNFAERDQMFDNVSYQKGGQILHMLRKVVGDEAFFQSLKLYLANNAFKTAEVHTLRLAFEEVTGQDLNWFFNQWFLSSGHPILSIETKFDAVKKEVTVIMSQNNASNRINAYRLPMFVDIYTENGVVRKHLVCDKPAQAFVFPVDFEPLLINVDAEKSILADKRESKTLNQYIFQFEKTPLFMDRYEAIINLGHFPKEKTAAETIIKALDDKNWYIRQTALNYVPSFSEGDKQLAYPKVKAMAIGDERSYVRATAISILRTTFSSDNIKAVLETALKDKAPSVRTAASGESKSSILITP